MRQRGLTPASRTLELHRRAAARARPHPPRLALRARDRREAPAPRRRRADGDRAPARARVAAPGLTRADLEEDSFYDLLADRYGIEIVGGTQTVEPTVTERRGVEVLGVPLHSPALLFERITRAPRGESSSSRSRPTAATGTGIVAELGVGGSGARVRADWIAPAAARLR
jgi:GntR family transcriptional regulator